MQEQKRHVKSDEDEAQVEPKALEPEVGDIDSVLDDIDDVLEENAEAFVSQYIQQGGQ